MTRLHLIRHGRVQSQWLDRIYGDLDVELSDEGRDQARAAAQILAPTALSGVASSDLSRAVFGARAVAEGRDLRAREDAALREISRGEWAGERIENLRKDRPGALEHWFEDPEDRRPPGGESISDLRARVLPALEALAKEHTGGAVAVVAHGWVVRSTVCWVLGLPSTRIRQVHVPPASITSIDWPVGCLERIGLAVDGESPHRDRPYLSSVNLDADPPGPGGWYRAPD